MERIARDHLGVRPQAPGGAAPGRSPRPKRPDGGGKGRAPATDRAAAARRDRREPRAERHVRMTRGAEVGKMWHAPLRRSGPICTSYRAGTPSPTLDLVAIGRFLGTKVDAPKPEAFRKGRGGVRIGGELKVPTHFAGAVCYLRAGAEQSAEASVLLALEYARVDVCL